MNYQIEALEDLAEGREFVFTLGYVTHGWPMDPQLLLRYNMGYCNRLLQHCSGGAQAELLLYEKLIKRLRHLCHTAFTLNVQIGIHIRPLMQADGTNVYRLGVSLEEGNFRLDAVNAAVEVFREDQRAGLLQLQNARGTAVVCENLNILNFMTQNATHKPEKR